MTHLSAAQIAQWVAGDRAPEAELHVEACAECRLEVTQFAETLREFRQSAASLPVRPVISRPKVPAQLGRWVAAAAAIIVLALVPVYRVQQDRKRAALEQQDAQLLQQVDAEISRAVPDAMDPLVKMVAWNSGEEQK